MHVPLIFVFELSILTFHVVNLAAKMPDINLILTMPLHEEIFVASFSTIFVSVCQNGPTSVKQFHHHLKVYGMLPNLGALLHDELLPLLFHLII